MRPGKSMSGEVLHVECAPAGGWGDYAAHEALIEALYERLSGWRYMNPTSVTAIWEAPQGDGLLYIEWKGGVKHLVATLPVTDDPCMETLLGWLADDFGVVLAGGVGA